MPHLQQHLQPTHKNQHHNNINSNKWTEIREIIGGFLSKCGTPVSKGAPFDKFEAECWDEARNRGYDIDTITPYMQPSIAIAALAYGHVQNEKARIYIALYTALAIYVDDTCEEGLQHFHERLMKGLPQESKTLNDFVEILPEMTEYWKPIPCGIISMAVLNFVTSILTDKETKAMKIHRLARRYADFMRLLSGIGPAYTSFIFPSELPVTDYIQATPDVTLYVNHTNDILSFFKEELANEDLNYISLKAKHNGMSNVESLRMLANDTADAYERALKILEGSPEAYEAFVSFARGYVEFHFAAEGRYKLNQLEL